MRAWRARVCVCVYNSYSRRRRRVCIMLLCTLQRWPRAAQNARARFRETHRGGGKHIIRVSGTDRRLQRPRRVRTATFVVARTRARILDTLEHPPPRIPGRQLPPFCTGSRRLLSTPRVYMVCIRRRRLRRRRRHRVRVYTLRRAVSVNRSVTERICRRKLTILNTYEIVI